MLVIAVSTDVRIQAPLVQHAERQGSGTSGAQPLLPHHIERRGDGDVGPALRVPQQAGTVLYTHRRLRTRSLKTIFGPVEIHRMGYSRDGVPSIYPLDQILALPARSFSYELQRRLVKAAVQNPFHESVEAIADLTGVSVPSGTTLAAATLTERVCCGLELDPKYVDVTVQRWQTLSGQAAMLEGDGRSFERVAQQRLRRAA